MRSPTRRSDARIGDPSSPGEQKQAFASDEAGGGDRADFLREKGERAIFASAALQADDQVTNP